MLGESNTEPRDKTENQKTRFSNGEKVAAWLIGGVVTIMLTAQLWTPVLDKAFPLKYEVTSSAQRVWQMNCGSQITNRLDRIAYGCE